MAVTRADVYGNTNMCKMGCHQIIGLVVGMLLSVASVAGVILSPIGVTDNTLGIYEPGVSIDYTHDGSGLPVFSSGVTDFDAYVATNPTHAIFDFVNAWGSAAGVFSGNIDYDLGAVYTITEVALWNQDDGADQGINSFDIFTSNNVTFLGALHVGSFAAADTSLLVQTFSLTPSTGQYVRLEINSNHGADCCTTLGEIALDVRSVPEPATLALLGIGLAGLRFGRRKQA